MDINARCEADSRILQELIKRGDDLGLTRFLGLNWDELDCWNCGKRGHIMKQCTDTSRSLAVQNRIARQAMAMGADSQQTMAMRNPTSRSASRRSSGHARRTSRRTHSLGFTGRRLA